MSYDIFHLSYKEQFADETFATLKSRFPWAQRVSGIKGIFNAHKKCAEQAYTEMFYVVDADADLDPSFVFDYKPTKWDLDKIHTWRCKNPINNLVYGYGGVKLFPTRPLPPVSNTTRFNTDPFNTFKSAFRECTKLSSKIIEKQKDNESEQRLNIWCSVGKEKEFGEYAIAGAIAGREYGETNKDNMEALNKINDFDWLDEQFRRIKI
jgi:hypothetical protein